MSTSANAAGGAVGAASVVPASATDAIWFYLDASGQQQHGPVSPDVLADLLMDQDINSKTLGWRNGLSEWAPLSSMPELKGLFATAFDAPDDTATAPATASNAKATSRGNGATAAAASATPAAPSTTNSTDPSAVWYYVDPRTRATKGPVRSDEIVRLYRLCQISDVTLVYKAAEAESTATAATSNAASTAATAASTAASSSAATPASASATPSTDTSSSFGLGWIRLSEATEFTGRIGADVVESAAAEREALAAQRKRKRERKKGGAGGGGEGGGWNARAAANHSNIYITGLPPDVTIEELQQHFKKGGIIQTELDGTPRIKIYKDESGAVKGDGLVKYALPDSVEHAITLLDGADLRPPKGIHLTVSKAEFQMHGDRFDTNKVDARIAERERIKRARRAGTLKSDHELARAAHGAMTVKAIEKQRLKESLSWDEEPSVTSKLRIIIMQPMFTLEEAARAPRGQEAFYSELKEEIRMEMEEGIGSSSNSSGSREKGCVEKLTVFAGNPSGVVAVKFRSASDAARALQQLNGRFFAGRRIQAFYYDGKTNYVVRSKKEESEEETARRLKEFGDWLEKGEEDE